MQYLGYYFHLKEQGDYRQDLLIDQLSEIGFDSFEDISEGFNAFIPASAWNEDDFKAVCDTLDPDWVLDIKVLKIENTNWNAEWEKNFQPIVVANQCYIRATFHPEKPEYPYQITINPKMSFGTGHHQTTAGIIELMMDMDFAQKSVLDMGCGTGILAIWAHLLGAKELLAIDYDDICVESTKENAILNHVPHLEVLCGSKEAIPSNRIFDIIIANINRNILLDQIETYVKHLKTGGYLLMSGFYEGEDLEMIVHHSEPFGLKLLRHQVKDRWTAVVFSYE